LAEFKLAELKDAAKSHKLHITGTKPLLIERLETCFKKINAAIQIQRLCRGKIVRTCIQFRGPALKNRRLCVNDSDFVTMDPLDEIPFFQFFSYKDEKDFVYGFHISSLMRLLKMDDHSITNPYNREKIPQETVINLIRVFNTSILLFQEFRKENQNRIPSRNVPLRQATVHMVRTMEFDVEHYQPTIQVTSILNEESMARLNRIRDLRRRPIDQRIRELFAEIDQLGNYTQSEWFMTLSHYEYGRLYRILYQIWNFRAQIPRSVRNKICPFHGPFESIFNRPMYPSDLNHRQLQIACLIVFENMVYSGVDEDHRKLGAFHALSALTMVSIPARIAMPWLYESIV
jgi:hypothetical protein